MKQALTQALRERNLPQARHLIYELQQDRHPEDVANLLWSAIESLAWAEGYQPAARWLMKNSPSTLKEYLPLR